MLETEIKKLTAAVEALTAQLSALQSVPVQQPDAPVEEPVTVTEEVPAEEVPVKEEPVASAFTRDDIQALCLQKVREDRALKAKIKTILDDVGASNVSGIPDAELEAVHTAINALGA